MRIIKICCFILLITASVEALGQEQTKFSITENSYMNTMGEEQSLVLQHYSGGVSFDRSFDYKIINKQRQLYMASRLALTGGFVAMLGTIAGFTCMMAIYDWNPAWSVPIEIVAGLGLCSGFTVWSVRLRAKADAIQVAPVYSYNVGKNLSVSAVGMGISTKRYNNKKMGVGIGLAANF